MKTTTILSAALSASAVLAAPLEKRQNIDAVVLQFALTLEHLENVFYKGALEKFSAAQFAAAGYGATYYNNLKYIAHDEEEHVKLLTSALTAAGQKPVAACTYNFPYTDVKSFITLSSVLEDVGTSAYLGGAGLITSKDYLTVAGAILAVEAKHTAYQRASINEVPFPNPYQTPLDPTSVFTLAASFIKSCPASNYALPFKPFPALTMTSPGPCSAGAAFTFTSAAAIPAGAYLTFVNGLSVVSVKGTVSGMTISAPIPAADQGQTYVFVTSSDVSGKFSDAAVVAGPGIIEVAPPAPSIDYNLLK